MKYARPAIQFLLFAVAAAALWYFFFPSPERVIRKRITQLQEAVSANPSGNIAAVANVNRIAGFFHPDVVLDLSGFGRDVAAISSRSELRRLAMAARQNLQYLEVSLNNVHIQLAEDEQSARVNLTAVVRLEPGQEEPAVQDIKLLFENTEGDWLIRSIEPIRPLM